MEAACRGAREAGGLTVGLLPGLDDADANPYLSLALVTGLGPARNAVIAQAGCAMISIAGSYGTLSEIALALKKGKPVISLGSWNLVDPDGCQAKMMVAHSPEEAVQIALAQAQAIGDK